MCYWLLEIRGGVATDLIFLYNYQRGTAPVNLTTKGIIGKG